MLLWKQRRRVPSISGTSKESAVILAGTPASSPSPRAVLCIWAPAIECTHLGMMWKGFSALSPGGCPSIQPLFDVWAAMASPCLTKSPSHVGLFILPQPPPLTRARIKCPRECNVYKASCCPTLPCLLIVPCPTLPVVRHWTSQMEPGGWREEGRGGEKKIAIAGFLGSLVSGSGDEDSQLNAELRQCWPQRKMHMGLLHTWEGTHHGYSPGPERERWRKKQREKG